MYVVEFIGILYIAISTAMLFGDWPGVSNEEAVVYFVVMYRTFFSDDLGHKPRKYHHNPLSDCGREI
jgi:hypothetical protein